MKSRCRLFDLQWSWSTKGYTAVYLGSGPNSYSNHLYVYIYYIFTILLSSPFKWWFFLAHFISGIYIIVMVDWWSAMSHEPEAQDRSIEACDPEGGRSRSKEEVLRETVYQNTIGIYCVRKCLYICIHYTIIICMVFNFYIAKWNGHVVYDWISWSDSSGWWVLGSTQRFCDIKQMVFFNCPFSSKVTQWFGHSQEAVTAFQGFKQHMADGINVTWLYKRQATGAWPELVHGYTCLGIDFLGWKRKLADLAKVLPIAHEIPVFIRKRCLQYLKMAYMHIYELELNSSWVETWY